MVGGWLFLFRTLVLQEGAGETFQGPMVIISVSFQLLGRFLSFLLCACGLRKEGEEFGKPNFWISGSIRHIFFFTVSPQ